MDFALLVAWRHLRAKRRASVSVIAFIAVLGITLGVAALAAVLSVTSGFQTAFREKVLGVNAHLLVLKYGWDFTEYRQVLDRVGSTPGVTGSAPFLINPMMITRGDKISGVLVKGVDPALLGQVLDLPSYIVQGSIQGLRRPGAQPPPAPNGDPGAQTDQSLDEYLRRARELVRARRNGAPPSLRTTEQRIAIEMGPDDPFPPRSSAGVQSSVLERHPGEVRTTGPRSSTTGSSGTRPVPTNLLPAGETQHYEPPPDSVGDDDPLRELGNEIVRQADSEAQRRAGELPGVVVGRTLAKTLNLHLGDQVRILSPLTGADTAIVRHGSAPRARDFRVVGIFDAGFDEYDSRLVYVDLWEAQRFFEQGDAVTGVEVKVRDIERASAIGRRIEHELGAGPYHTLDWESLNRNLFTALKLQKIALSIVITIIIVVAAFNVVATLVMAVLDKRREVAILKAMGADRSGILRIFLLQGLAIGGTGTALGVLLGGIVCGILSRWHFPLDPQVYLIRYVPVRVSGAEFALTAAVALHISIIASLIPAAWAASLHPVEGLRYE